MQMCLHSVKNNFCQCTLKQFTGNCTWSSSHNQPDLTQQLLSLSLYPKHQQLFSTFTHQTTVKLQCCRNSLRNSEDDFVLSAETPDPFPPESRLRTSSEEDDHYGLKHQGPVTTINIPAATVLILSLVNEVLNTIELFVLSRFASSSPRLPRVLQVVTEVEMELFSLERCFPSHHYSLHTARKWNWCTDAVDAAAPVTCQQSVSSEKTGPSAEPPQSVKIRGRGMFLIKPLLWNVFPGSRCSWRLQDSALCRGGVGGGGVDGWGVQCAQEAELNSVLHWALLLNYSSGDGAPESTMQGAASRAVQQTHTSGCMLVFAGLTCSFPGKSMADT